MRQGQGTGGVWTMWGCGGGGGNTHFMLGRGRISRRAKRGEGGWGIG